MGTVSMALAGIPDLTNSTATTAAGTQVSVYCSTVAGVGQTLLQAKTAAGVGLNATITLTLKDGNGDPIFGYPREDLWLATSLGGLVVCTPSIAAANTNALGVTTFVDAVLAKGHSNRNGGEKTVIMIAGAPLTGSQLDILFNSADINADNIVNISDTAAFVSALKGLAADNYYANFVYDASVNISDTASYVAALKSVLQGCQ
jgi:hypothetical protein